MTPTIDEIIQKHMKYSKLTLEDREDLSKSIFDWINDYKGNSYSLAIGSGPSVRTGQ